jgi:RNA polymerase sigma factor (sigma-70 family)
VTDLEIVQGITQKDNTTFLYLYQTHKDRIIHMVHKNSGSNADALDIFQEGIIALWTNISQGKYELQENAKIGTYLFALCRNLWISKLRKKKVEKPIDNEAPFVDQSTVDLLEDEYEQVKELTDFFNKLGDACKKLLDLFYYKKNSLKEIALLMSITEKTAKNNKYRCMQSLRQLYDKKSRT